MGLLGLAMWPIGKALGRLGLWIFQPLRSHPQIELLFVMVIYPTIVNFVCFWITDFILEGATPKSLHVPNAGGAHSEGPYDFDDAVSNGSGTPPVSNTPSPAAET